MIKLSSSVVLLVACASQQSYAVTPVAASMRLTAIASSVNHVRTVTDAEHAEWGSVLSPLSLSASAQLKDDLNVPQVTVHGSGASSWIDANHGSVSLTNYGWEFNNSPGRANLVPSNAQIRSPDWTYTFVADKTTTFTMHAQIVGHGDLIGLQGWNVRLYFNGTESFGGTTNVFNPNLTWDYTRELVAGVQYTATLANGTDIEAPNSISLRGAMDGLFTWRIGAEIPEPSTLLLAAVGLPLLLRRRRSPVRPVAARESCCDTTVCSRSIWLVR